MPDRPVVLNNTPLVAFWTLGRLDLLRDLFQEVLIPQTVQTEFLATEKLARRAALEAAPWVKSTPLENPRRVLAFVGLDRGEADVLALAEERQARLVVIDEKKARRYAERLGLTLTGTLGLLVLAKERGLIDAVGTWITKLEEAGLHLSPALVQKTLALAGEA